MKKALIVIACLAGFLLEAWTVARLTHLIEFYSIPSESNEPTYYPGALVIASRFKTPDTNTFLCFRNTRDHALYISRCVARGGDVIEIRNAAVYLNGRRLDEPFVYNEYLITQTQLATIAGYVKNNKNPVRDISNDTSIIAITTAELGRYHLKLTPYLYTRDGVDPMFYPDFKKRGFTPDNLGPVSVPAGCYFVMGDNRHLAYDSRYLGFIRRDQVLATVLRRNPRSSPHQ